MLTSREATIVLKTTNQGHAQVRNSIRVFPEGANVDDRVVGVVVDVQDWSERDVDAHGAGLQRRDSSQLVGVARIARGAERHQRRERRRPTEHDVGRDMNGSRKAETRPRLQVRGHQKRILGMPLEVVELDGHLAG